MQQVENTLGVTETLECLDLLKAAAEELQDFLQSDTKPTLLSLGMKLYQLSAPITVALRGIDKVDDELKNLSEDEFKNKLGPRVIDLGYVIYRDIVANVKN